MRRFLFAAVVAAMAYYGIGENIARAQGFQLGTKSQPQVRQRPPLSPYINMLNGGNPAVDYYGLVRPQIEANSSIGALQQGFNSLLADSSTLAQQGQVQQTATNTLGGMQTGHRTSFFNYQNYFPLSFGSPGMSGTSSGGAYGSSSGGLGSSSARSFYSNNLNSLQTR